MPTLLSRTFSEFFEAEKSSANSLGIIAGLMIGKPLGIVLLCYVAVAMGLCRFPVDLNWRHFVGAGILAGIGFTMSIFIRDFPLEIFQGA